MFTDSIDMSRTPETYGTSKCGPVRGVVTDMNGNVVDFASFNESTGMLTLHPLQTTVPDTYQLVVHFYMQDYDFRWTNEPFIATVNVCTTTILSNGASLTDVITGWGDDFVGIDASAALSMFTMSPDCGYALEVSPKLMIGADLVDLPVPFSLSYEDQSATLVAGKCSSTTFSMDPECAYEPYEIIYDVVFVVSANNMASVNTALQVRVEIGNSCLTDSVAIESLIVDGTPLINDSNPEIIYVINDDAQTVTIVPNLNQGYNFCPVTATLNELSATGIDPSTIVFNPYTGGFEVATADRAMHNVQTSWELVIIPTYNSNYEAQIITFTVTFFDDCYNAVVTPAWSAGASVPLYVATDILYTLPGVNMSCGVISNSLTLLNSDSDDPSFGLVPTNKINIFGSSVNHLGQHYLRIKSCITVYNQGVPVTCANCCANSDPFIVEIFDPCLGATINTNSLPTGM